MSWWGLIQTFSNHYNDDMKPIKHISSSQPDLQVPGLQLYATSLQFTPSQRVGEGWRAFLAFCICMKIVFVFEVFKPTFIRLGMYVEIKDSYVKKIQLSSIFILKWLKLNIMAGNGKIYLDNFVYVLFLINVLKQMRIIQKTKNIQ